MTLASLPAATHVPAVRRFTALFKDLLRVGFEHTAFILDSWSVVRAAAQAHLDLTKQPGLHNAMITIDRVVKLAAALPKPKPKQEGEEDDDDDEDDKEQQDLPVVEQPGAVKA